MTNETQLHKTLNDLREPACAIFRHHPDANTGEIRLYCVCHECKCTHTVGTAIKQDDGSYALDPYSWHGWDAGRLLLASVYLMALSDFKPKLELVK